MDTRWTATLLGCLLTVAATAETPRAIRVELVDLTGIAHSLTRIGPAANAVLEPLGTPVELEVVPAGRVSDASRVRVILLDSEPPRPRHDSPDLLAVTRVETLPTTIWVYLPAVRRAALVRAAGASLGPGELRDVGTAIGRILVHELVHVAEPSRPHARRGLMAPSLGRSLLVDGSPTLDEGSRRVLARNARRLATQLPGRPLPPLAGPRFSEPADLGSGRR
jgi:hypothetical protein